MSTITITLQTQALDFAPLTRGVVNVIFNDGNQDLTLNLQLDSISIYKRFLEVAWVNGASGEDDQQAVNYKNAFNRDYPGVGSTGEGPIKAKNLTAVAQGNQVIITAINGTFPDGQSNYTGNVLTVGFTYNNTVQVIAPKLTVTPTGNGDCDNVEYTISASGDGSPWALSDGLTIIDSNWDGTAIPYNMDRASIQHDIVLAEPSPSFSELDRLTVIVPRNLKIGEFKQRTTQNIGGSDILIESVNPVLGTTPIEYSLDVQGTLTGDNYQTSNTFPSVAPGFYELFVKDVFGCEVTKTIQVTAFEDPTETQNPRYFDVPKGNSIIMSECVTFDEATKPNFNNTLSHNEPSIINYEITQYFNEKDFEPIHFKSSYPFHVATLHKCDGTKQNLPIVLVQENRGAKEKVDCQLFPIDGKTGVYFDGGNLYEPDTTTIIDSSPYVTTTPRWDEGQLVTIDGMGTFEVEELGYDADLQKGYFLIDTFLSSATSGIIQVIWNIQPYNVFECYVPFNTMNKGRVVIEKGFSFSEIDGNLWASELLQVKENEIDDLLIEWNSIKNQSDIVFFSGVKFKKRIKGKFRPIFPNSSEIAEGDSRAYSLNQEFYQHYKLELDWLSAREVYQLMVASKTDGFRVNGESLIMKEEATYEELGESNYYTFKCDYAYGGNNSAQQPDSIALNSSTGVIGGGSTGKPTSPPAYDGKTRLNIGGGFLRIGEGFVSI